MRRTNSRTCRRPTFWLTAVLAAVAASKTVIAEVPAPPPRAASYQDVIGETARKVVKIYGAGGIAGLEAYQSGILISEFGHVLTCWSTVLDSETLTVVLDDGRRLRAELLGADPVMEVAVLKVETTDAPHFQLRDAPMVSPGTRILAFSNLFGVAAGSEPVSVQRGVIAGATRLEARRGVFETPYREMAYIVDAVTNNPGATGGALTDQQGHLLGMLGKELRNALNDTWLNYAIPEHVLHTAVQAIVNGTSASESRAAELLPQRPWTLDDAGLVLVPNVLDRTPPYVDWVRPKSVAAQAGLQPDDLLLYVNGALVRSRQEVEASLRERDAGTPLQLTVARREEIVECTLQPMAAGRP